MKTKNSEDQRRDDQRARTVDKRQRKLAIYQTSHPAAPDQPGEATGRKQLLLFKISLRLIKTVFPGGTLNSQDYLSPVGWTTCWLCYLIVLLICCLLVVVFIPHLMYNLLFALLIHHFLLPKCCTIKFMYAN